MSKRLAVYRASTVVMLAVMCGCTLPTTKKPGAAAPTTEDTLGSTIAGRTGAPLHGLLANNAAGVVGTVRGPSSALIANNAAGLISNNSGGLISNNSGGLISNNSGGLISNNSGGLISNNSGGYRIAATENAFIPYVKAKVTVYDAAGTVLLSEWVTTNDKGEFGIKKVKESGPMVFVEAEYTIGGKDVSLMAATKSPREKDVNVHLDPVTTFVGKKLREAFVAGVGAGTLKPETVIAMQDAVNKKMSERAAVAAVLFDDNKAAQTFDNMLAESPELRDALTKIVTANGLPKLLDKTKASAESLKPATPRPTTGTTPTTAPSTNTGASPTPTPSTAPAAEPKGTVFTLGKATMGNALAFNGTTLFAGHEGGVQKATVSSATGTVTFAADGTEAAKAVTFDGTSKYLLQAGKIIKPNGTSVTMTGVPAVSDFVVSGTTAYVVDSGSHRIYKVDLTTGAGTVLAGGTAAGSDNGKGSAATFNTPTGIALLNGALYVADSANRCIRKVTLDGDVSVYAGGNSIGTVDGTGTAARFNSPRDVAADDAGNLYVADIGANNIRKIDSAAAVTTLAGSGNNESKDGVGKAASFSFATSIAFGKVGGESVLFVGEGNGTVRLISKW